MTPEIVSLIRDAAAWRLLGLLFECPAEGWSEQIAALAAETDDPELLAAAAAACTEANANLYHTTFGPGGPAAPREVSYLGRILPGQVLGDLSGYYQAFAYAPAMPEAPDHVAVEAGFVGYLRLKEAYAVARGDDDQARIAGEAARRFIADHLNAIGEPLADALTVSGIAYLAKTAAALRNRVGPRRQTAAAQTGPVLGECDATAGCPWADEES